MAFIVALEGASNSHKTTTTNLLIDRLQFLGVQVVDIRPKLEIQGSVPKIVQSLTHPIDVVLTPQQEVLLYSTRLAHKRMLIDEYLTRDSIILLDRYSMSIMVLGHYVRGLAFDQVQNVLDFAMNDVKPDLTIVLDMDYTTYYQRLIGRGRTVSRKEAGGESVIHKFLKGFREEAQRNDSSAVLIDTRYLSIDNLVEQTLDIILSKCPNKYLPNNSFVYKTRSEEYSSDEQSTSSRLLYLNQDKWPPVDCIVYDLEGTLFFSETFGPASSVLASECIASIRSISHDHANRILHETRSKLSEKSGYKVSLTATLVNLGIDLNYWNSWQSKIDLNEHTTPDRDIQSNINAVAEKYKVIVLTNMTSSLALRTIEFLGLQGAVTELLTSDINGFAKPDLGIYGYISQKHSLLPTDILSVGDRYDVDLEPAIKFGAFGCTISNKLELLQLGRKLILIRQ